MMWSGMEGMGWGWIGLGALHMLAFWALVILAVAMVFKWLGGESENGARAMDILKARYARGELTREQFESMKHDLVH
jgi:putative membrane protein